MSDDEEGTEPWQDDNSHNDNPDDSKADEQENSDSDYPDDYSSHSSGDSGNSSDSDYDDDFNLPKDKEGKGINKDLPTVPTVVNPDTVAKFKKDFQNYKKKYEKWYGDPTEDIDKYFAELDYEKQWRENEHLKLEDREDLYNFPEDKEDWQEEDLKELWADGPPLSGKTGWDPMLADDNEMKIVLNEIKQGKDIPLTPYYVPYRKYYPIIPNYFPPLYKGKYYRPYSAELATPTDIIEDLDMVEEFLKWVSYIFPDGSSYEGTVWDDVAQGKGVYVADKGLVRYEGEWLQNEMEGHGVVEVDLPDIEPIPGSELEKEMRAEGKIIKRDYVHPEDKEWLQMDIEDSVELADGKYVTPFYEKEEWVKIFGQKPEKGRYRYAGQWKHSRMHGCGVYEVNGRTITGRFYFGELLEDPAGCDEEISMMHGGIAEVAAAKARMFVNKPDGMVREQRGPFTDPQHPYFYEQADTWQAPGFVSQFYDVPDVWKTYAHEVDQEREMWLNSFYRAPLRLPMPAELEHLWEKDPEDPEFVLINKEPEPDPEDPTKLVYTEDPLILHVKTGRLINYVEDEEHGIRLFWQPPAASKEDIDASKVEFLPLGFEDHLEEGYKERMEKEEEQEEEKELKRLDKRFSKWWDEWIESKKREAAERKLIFEKEMELADLEVELEEELEEMAEDLEAEIQQEEQLIEKEVQQVSSKEEEKVSVTAPVEEEKTEPKKETVQVQEEEDEEEEDEVDEDEEEESDDDNEEDDVAPSSFGTVKDIDSSVKGDGKGSGKSPFSTLSLATSGLMSAVRLFPLKAASHHSTSSSSSSGVSSSGTIPPRLFKSTAQFLRFHGSSPVEKVRLRMAKQSELGIRVYRCPRRRRLDKQVAAAACKRSSHDFSARFGNPRTQSKSFRNLNWLHKSPENQTDCVLSLHFTDESFR